MSSSERDDDTLVVILEGVPIGRIERRGRALRLTYDDHHRDDPHATTLSASLPAAVRHHTGRVLTAWLWGLLPDNADVLGRWGREFGVSVASPFPLLATQVGHDCAGAVQFCAPGEVDDLLARPKVVQPLGESEIAARLRALRVDATAWLGPEFTGRFSLAGAQAKTALTFDEQHGWGQPGGSAPTTHILKPAVVGLDGHDLNEHLCLAAARRCGLTAVSTRVEAFEDQTAIVVDRYDRRIVAGEIIRIHQEDVCQALGVDPTRKYQSDGGPSPADVVGLLRSVLSADRAQHDVWRFVDALAFNWIVAGTDAHAKNYSLLHAGHQTRLAPLYDIASALPYDRSGGHKLKLAMKIGREYRLLATDRASSWRSVALGLALPDDEVATRVSDLAARVGAAFADVAADPSIRDLGSDIPEQLVVAVSGRADACLRVMA